MNLGIWEILIVILILTILCGIPIIVLIGIGVAVVLLNKRLSPSSWFRKILAVITGVIVDLGGTNLVSGIYTAILAFRRVSNLVQQNLSSAEIQERLLSELNPTIIGMSIPMIVFGMVLSVLGGYVAGKIARHNEIVYGIATGIGVLLVSVTLTLLTGLSANSQSPVWQLALSLVVNVGSTTLGGYLAFLHRKRKEASLVASNPETPQEGS